MSQNILFAFIAFFSFSISFAQNADFSVNMRILVLSADLKNDETSSNLTAQNVLRGFRIPFDVVQVIDKNGKPNLNGPLNLVNPDGSGKYYGVILTDQKLLTKVNNKQVSALTPAQWNELTEYEKNYHVRHLSLTTKPSNLLGLKDSDLTAEALSLSSQFQSIDPSLVPNFTLDVNDIFTYPASTSIANSALTPFAYFFPTKSPTQKSLAGVALKEASSGREELHLFFTHRTNVMASYVMGSTWVNWITRGIYLGFRRIYLNVQLDDLFLTSDVATAGGPGSVKTYRITADDMEQFVHQKNNDILKLTKNPDYKIEWPFNGEGISLNGGFDKDGLYLKSRELLKEFYWLSHTYTHQDLDEISYKEADKELKQNIEVSKKLMAGAEMQYSPSSMVTPHISGLFNGNAIRAIKDNGIKYVVGDNSVDKLRPPNPHTAYYTTAKIHGEPGLLIIPREATNVDYNLSLPQEIIKYFRALNGNDKPYTLEDVYANEVLQYSFMLLNYRAAPYMFHQVNMRGFTYKGSHESLISLWIKNIIQGARQFSTLPVLSVKQDDMAQLFLNEKTKESAQQQGRLIFKSGQATEIELTAKENCVIDITSVRNDFKDIKSLSYGPDKTIKVPVMMGSRQTVFLDQAISL